MTKKILIATSAAFMEKMISAVLQEHAADLGFDPEITKAADGVSAYEHFTNEPFDLLILNQHLAISTDPVEYDGIAVLALIRKTDPEIPVIMMAQPMWQHDAVEFGATAFLALPFNQNDLVSMVKKCIG